MRNDLFVASENGDLETIKNLYGQDSRVLSDITLRGDNALHIAAREGHEHIVGWILQVDSLEPALVVARNEDDNTPLHEAAKCSNPDLVKILSDQKRSCASQLNKFGETPLTIACKYGHEQTVKQLLDLEGGVTSILHAAVHGGNLEIVKAILNYRAWHNDLMTEKDNYGRCAVHVAARKGRWDIIEQFMSKVRDCVQIRSLDHKSVLHFAVEYNHLEIVRNLLADKKESKKAELVSRDHDLSHNTALHLAAKDGVDSQLVDLLLRDPVGNINALNDEDMTALDIASAAAQRNPNCAYIARKLEAAGAFRSSFIPKSTDKDTVNTHMIVASLIATVTFTAIFQIPGGFEDDKGSIHYGAAKMAFRKLFRCFIFCDTAAFTTSVTVVAAWLVRQQLPASHFQGTLLRHLSGTCLPVSIVWTIAAFVTAAIIVIIPPSYDKLKTRDKEAFAKYKLFMEIEIYIAIVAPLVGSLFFYILIWYREKLFSKYARKVIPIYLYCLMFLVTCLIIISTVK